MLQKKAAARLGHKGTQRRRVTAIEVARLAGVSQSTVSRAYTPGKGVSEEARAKILEAAHKLGYRPNLLASSLITGRSQIIAVAVSSLSHFYYIEALQSLSIAFARVGLRVMLFSLDSTHRPDPILEEILRYQVDAVVLVSSNITSHFADECLQSGLPVVLLNRLTNSRSAAAVTGDDQGGARLIARFLLAAGHHRFAYLSGERNSSTNRFRYKSYVDTLASEGGVSPDVVVGDFSYASGIVAARKLLKSRNRPDAIFCANDDMALAVIDVARDEFHLTVGEDLSIIGFDDIWLAGRSSHSLTTYRQPTDALVREVVELVVAAITTGELLHGVHRVLNGKLVVRKSARKPATGVFETQSGDVFWRPDDAGDQ